MYLKDVYSWLTNKLGVMGLLSKRDRDAEADIINPMGKLLAKSMK